MVLLTAPVPSTSSSRIPVKSTSTSLATNNSNSNNTNSSSNSFLLYPPPTPSFSSSHRHRQKNNSATVGPSPGSKSRSTATPRLNGNRARTLSSSSGSTLASSQNWVTGLFNSVSSSSSSSNGGGDRKNSNNIKSVVRLLANENRNWQVDEDGKTVRHVGFKTKKFEFDHVFGDNTTNRHIFNTCVIPTIEGVMNGYNGTVFTYGQPKTGKTHTMFGNRKDPGITAFSLDAMFEYIKTDHSHEYILRLSYFEISNETIRDLLVEDQQQQPPSTGGLKISDDNKRRGAYVTSLQEKVISTANEALQYIRKGETNRYLLSNNYNNQCHASKSHTFLQVTVEKRDLLQIPLTNNSNNSRNNHSMMSASTSTSTSTSTNTSNGSSNLSFATNRKPTGTLISRAKRENIHISYLYLIDLASNDKSAHYQQVLKNPANKSCVTLEAVVHNLSETGKSAGHPLPPYHDSKLTRLLQPSLMGQSNVVSICTANMEAALEDEMPTMDTFHFAHKIKKIPTMPKVCEISEDKSLLVKYSNEISFLKLKLEMIEQEQQQSRGDNSNMTLIKPILEQRLYNKSKCILNSKSLSFRLPASTALTEDENEDPWRIIAKLCQDYDTLALNNSTLRAAVKESKGLPDKVAQLEAELNITRAELQVTQLLVKEAGPNNTMNSNDNRLLLSPRGVF